MSWKRRIDGSIISSSGPDALHYGTWTQAIELHSITALGHKQSNFTPLQHLDTSNQTTQQMNATVFMNRYKINIEVRHNLIPV